MTVNEHLSALRTIYDEQATRIEALEARIAELEQEPPDSGPGLPYTPIEVRVNAYPHLNQRDAIGLGADKVGALPNGATVTAFGGVEPLSGDGIFHPTELRIAPENAVGRANTWMYVEHEDVRGWCAAWYLRPFEPAPAEYTGPTFSGHKLGAHADQYVTDLPGWYEYSGSNILLINAPSHKHDPSTASPQQLDTARMLHRLLADNPDLRVVIKDYNNLIFPVREAYQEAAWWYQKTIAMRRALEGIDKRRVYFMPSNELNTWLDAYPYQMIADTLVECGKILEMDGWRMAAGAIASSDAVDWPALESLFAYLDGSGHALALNMYWRDAVEGWRHTPEILHYRDLYEDYLLPNGYTDIPLIITEIGMGSSHDSRDGFRNLTTHKAYADSLLALNDEVLQPDPYVMGACIFIVAAQSQGDWSHYDWFKRDESGAYPANVRDYLAQAIKEENN